MILQFIPMVAFVIPVVILAVVVVCVFFFIRFLVSMCIGKNKNWISLIAFPALLTAVVVYLILPKLHEHSDVVNVATPGKNISVVLETFGKASQSYSVPNGTSTYLDAEEYIVGFTAIETDAKGIITRVYYAD